MARQAQGLTQEDLSVVSSRTYVSTLERAQKSPTLDKAHLLSEAMGVHLLSILALAYLHCEFDGDMDVLIRHITAETERLKSSPRNIFSAIPDHNHTRKAERDER